MQILELFENISMVTKSTNGTKFEVLFFSRVSFEDLHSLEELIELCLQSVFSNQRMFKDFCLKIQKIFKKIIAFIE